MYTYVAVSILVIYYLHKLLIKPNNYWKDRNVPHRKPILLFGNMGNFVLRKKNLATIIQELYNSFPDKRYIGVYQFRTPLLMIRDLDLIKKIAIKDFDHFTDHLHLFPTGVDEFLDKTLLGLRGSQWREMRSTLSPAFTSAKMKNMFILIVEVAENFTNFFMDKNESCIEIEVKEIFGRFTMDIVGSSFFGISCDSLKNPNNEFYQTGLFMTKIGIVQVMKIILAQFSPSLVKLTGGFLPKYVTDFTSRLVHDTIKEREEKNIQRPDLIHLLTQARKGQLKHDKTVRDESAGYSTVEESDIGKQEHYQKKQWEDDDITAQALAFFLTGFETTSTIAGFTAYELAMNPDIQKKLQNEIDSVKSECKDGKVAYDSLLKMKYLDQVISETLRKYPVGAQADRICVKAYEILPEQPDEETVIVEEGIGVSFPIYAIHWDPQYFPEPDKFDPERFNDTNKINITPGSYMPFGVGPRNCIGCRFSLMTLKSLFFYLLADFDLVKIAKTKTYCIDPKKILMSPQGIQLGFNLRKKTV